MNETNLSLLEKHLNNWFRINDPNQGNYFAMECLYSALRCVQEELNDLKEKKKIGILDYVNSAEDYLDNIENITNDPVDGWDKIHLSVAIKDCREQLRLAKGLLEEVK